MPPAPHPSLEAVVKCWWNPAQHSLIFPPLIFFQQRNEGSGGAPALRLFSSFKPSLSQICLFSPLCICVRSHRKHSFLFKHLPERYHWTPLLGFDEVTAAVEKLFSHTVDWSTGDLKSAFTCNSLSSRFNWRCKSEGITMRTVCLPRRHMRVDGKEDKLNLESHSCHSA